VTEIAAIDSRKMLTVTCVTGMSRRVESYNRVNRAESSRIFAFASNHLPPLNITAAAVYVAVRWFRSFDARSPKKQRNFGASSNVPTIRRVPKTNDSLCCGSLSSGRNIGSLRDESRTSSPRRALP
jgi:L-asparaginase/Glu-tRNA(Gln) amidotransferase subunit D